MQASLFIMIEYAYYLYYLSLRPLRTGLRFHMIIHDYLMTFLSPSMTRPRVVLVAGVPSSLQGIFLCAGLAGPDVAGVELLRAWQSLVAASDHRAAVSVDDVEVGVEVHLHLPELMVAHDDDGVMAYVLIISDSIIVSLSNEKRGMHPCRSG